MLNTAEPTQNPHTLNGLILYVLIKKLKLDSIELKFIFLLCVVEIVLGVDMFTFAIIKLVHGYTFFAPNNIPCIVYGYTISWFMRFEFFIVCVLALSRYLAVVHEYISNLKLLAIITLAGMSPTTIILMYGLVNMDAKPYSSYIMRATLANTTKLSTILNILSTILLLIPCWITTYCYFFIGWKANKN